ncbi:hypothetical protein N310_08402, partial [Acanthisitta chloris]
MCKGLIFSCISAVILMTAAYGAPLATKEQLLTSLISDLKILEKSKDKIYVDLYTPNDKQECSSRTLQCYQTEITILENEIEDEDARHALRNIYKNLKERCHKSIKIFGLQDKNPTGTGCKICEAHDKKEFPEFHQELSSFLQSMLK